jgi:hypothetical protein
VLDREFLVNPKTAARTFYHELGHELDNRLGISEHPVWGKGKNVTDYASTNAKEDVAETFSMLQMNRELYLNLPKERLLEKKCGLKKAIMLARYGRMDLTAEDMEKLTRDFLVEHRRN